MIILGIDPGYATIGYGVVEKKGSSVRPVDYGVITTPQNESIAYRLAMIYDMMNKTIEKFSPDEIAIEELFFNTNITTGIKVAEARGVILLSAIKSCGKLFEYTPLMIKQSLTGNGRADKHQVQYMVQAILKLKSLPRPDDAADALAAAVCHANMCGFNQRII